MSTPLQKKLLDKILDRYEKKAEAVDELAKLLNVGKDAIYRRLRNDTELKPDEISLLAQHFNLSIDTLIFEQSDSVFFSYNQFSTQVKSFEGYLQEILQVTSRFLHIPNTHFYYTTKDIPLFQYMYFPELIRFKLYVWGMTAWGFDFLDARAFSFDLVPPHNVELARTIANNYNRLPSTELWGPGIFDNTLDQIEYIASIGGFQIPTDALLLCDKLLELLQHMQKMAKYGSKFNPGSQPQSQLASFHLYHNELVSTNNSILVNFPNGQMLFNTHGNPNFLFTSDEKLCKHSENWFMRILSKSTAISIHGDRIRNQFFRKLEHRIADKRQHIKAAL